jgi:3-phenylpropionate/trans-cinnamate dioxygenase ferredoxin reductase subunit
MSEIPWEKTVPEKDLREGIPASAEFGEKAIFLVRKGDRILALEGECTHYGGTLADGLLRGHVITCPLHTARFDIETGAMISPPALTDLAPYETKVEKGFVYVRKAPLPRPRVPGGKDGRTFLVLGAGAAGTAAALALRKNGFTGRVLMVTPEPDLPYDRPILSKDYMAGEAPKTDLPLRPVESYRELGIEIWRDKTAVALDRGKKIVRFSDASVQKYDRLLLATGGTPRIPNIPGTKLPGFFVLRSRANADAIIMALDRAKTVAIMGASFIGLEVASALRKRGLEVHVAAPEAVPLGNVFGEKLGGHIRKIHEEKGVRFHLGLGVAEIAGEKRVEGMRLLDGTTIKAEVVIAGIGVIPAISYLDGSGLAERGAVPVNARFQTADPDIFAVGDIAVLPDPHVPEGRRVEHWVEAERQGQHAAKTMLDAGEDYREVPFFWTVQHGVSLKYAGFVKKYDAVEYRGSLDEKKVMAGFYQGQNLRAVASLGRTKELIAASELLKAGENIPPERFRDVRSAIV